ncbi:hypothetical protein D1P53_006331 [Cryptococcus gattii VGV]|nr:hypothetical protein D1P53_006331 [Cryptococcus gattii VGV]
MSYGRLSRRSLIWSSQVEGEAPQQYCSHLSPEKVHQSFTSLLNCPPKKAIHSFKLRLRDRIQCDVIGEDEAGVMRDFLRVRTRFDGTDEKLPGDFDDQQERVPKLCSKK